ncbi:MAG: tRNA lysidine(34) synthetase TilS [Candidatus Velamenicoccus archaeovorus]
MARPPAVARVVHRLTATAREHGMFPPGGTVLVAVSGGPDSMCLLHALVEARRLLRIRLAVFHFDHRLRRGSAEDAAYVRRAAERLGLPFHLREATTAPEPGASLEDWAHRARFEALALTMRDADAIRAALGHTRDDQAETALIALIRGGGLDALAGLRPVQGPYVRPLLDVTHDEVEAFCRARHLRPRRDPTNRELRLLRNAVRLRVLPAIERATGRDPRAPMARSAGLLRRDADELERQATDAIVELLEEAPEGQLVPATALSSLPGAIAARVARAALYRCGVLPTLEDVEAVLDLASGRPGRRRRLTGGLLAARDREYVSVSRTSPESRG